MTRKNKKRKNSTTNSCDRNTVAGTRNNTGHHPTAKRWVQEEGQNQLRILSSLLSSEAPSINTTDNNISPNGSSDGRHIQTTGTINDHAMQDMRGNIDNSLINYQYRSSNGNFTTDSAPSSSARTSTRMMTTATSVTMTIITPQEWEALVANVFYFFSSATLAAAAA